MERTPQVVWPPRDRWADVYEFQTGTPWVPPSDSEVCRGLKAFYAPDSVDPESRSLQTWEGGE